MILLFVAALLPAADVPNIFVKTMPITRIYVHSLGFKVLYLKSDLTQGAFYVPISWFDTAGGKGVLIKGNDPSYPYFSIFWKDGKFDSIKIYVKASFDDPTWGSLGTPEGAAEKFNIEELKLDF